MDGGPVMGRTWQPRQFSSMDGGPVMGRKGRADAEMVHGD